MSITSRNLLQEMIIDRLISVESNNLLARTDRQFVHFEIERIRANPHNKSFTLIHQDALIIKMTVIMPYKSVQKVAGRKLMAEYDSYNGCVIIHTWDKTRAYALSPRHYIQVIRNINVLVENYNGLIEQTFANLRSLSTRSMPLKYTPAVEKLYSKVRPLIASIVVDELKELKLAVTDDLTVTSLGCGRGDDLRECSRIVTATYPKSTFIGYDHSKELIELAALQSSAAGEKNIHFFAEDCKILRKFTQSDLKAKFNIGIAVGFLARQVLAGTKEALPVYQNAYRKFDVFINTGFTHPLITLDIATAVGWVPALYNYKVAGGGLQSTLMSVYVLRKPGVKNVLARFVIKERLFNLSISAAPLEDLQTFIANHHDMLNLITKIDLSFAYFLPEEIPVFLRLLNQLKNLTTIYHDPSDVWIDAIKVCSEKELKTKPRLKFVSLNLRQGCEEELPFYSRSTVKVLQTATANALQPAAMPVVIGKKYLSVKDLIAFSLVSNRSRLIAKMLLDAERSFARSKSIDVR